MTGDTSGNIEYRVATSRDAGAMLECRRDDPGAGPGDPRTAAYLDGHHHPQKALAPRTAFVAVRGRHVVGYIAGHLTRRYDCDGEVQYLYVVPQQRRRGVATELLRMLSGWFTEHGARRVCVNVDVDSPAAAPFYVRHGAARLSEYWYVWDDISVVSGRSLDVRAAGRSPRA